jgi:hypothetical protein
MNPRARLARAWKLDEFSPEGNFHNAATRRVEEA